MSLERAERLFLYAAGALDPEEREQLETELLADAALRDELAEERARWIELALALDPQSPRPTVRARLLARVRADAGRGALLPSARAWWRPALAAGLAGGLLTASVTWAYLEQKVVTPLQMREGEVRRELDEARMARQELSRSLSEQDEELYQLEDALEQAREQLELLRSPDLQSVALRGAGSQPDAHARVFWEWESYGCYLHASDLRPPADGELFALWVYNEDGDVVRAGTFLPNARGEANFFTRLPQDTGRVVRTLVTAEPEDVGERPQGEVVLASRESLP